MPDTNKYDLPPYVLSRVRYFDGEYLKDDEFIDEQKFHIDRRRRHDRLLHVAGVCEGMVASVADAKTLRVSAGTAIDDQGREMLLDVERLVPIGSASGNLFIEIAYGEKEDRLADANSAVSSATRFTQDPVFKLSASRTAGAVALGQAIIAPGNPPQVTQVTATGRMYSGLRMPGPGGQAYILHARGDATPGLVDLECSLHVTGNQSVAGNHAVTGNVTVTGNTALGVADAAGNKLRVVGETRLDGSLTITGPRLKNKDGLGVLQMDASDWLRVNPDQTYPGIALFKPVAIGTGGLAIGEWTQQPAGQLKVTGNAIFGGEVTIGSGAASVQNNFMATGSLTIGNVAASFGGGTGQWNANTAGLLLETARNTEIAVHDSGTRVASLMYYEGDADNRLTIGRNMGWGTLSTVVLNGNVGIGVAQPGDLLDVRGSVRINTDKNPIRFTSAWSSFPDGTTNQAEISNDTGTYKTLMIIGNRSAGLTSPGIGRRVSIWDRLEVNGNMLVTAGLVSNGLNIGSSGTQTTYSWPYESLGTDAPGHNLRLCSRQSIAMHAPGSVIISKVDPGGSAGASGNISVEGALSFGSQVRQMINLWSTGYGIGIQSGTLYFRTDKNFTVFQGGTHSDAENTPGAGGKQLMNLQDGVASLGVYDFLIGHPSRSKKLGRALVDATTTLVVNYGPDWPFIQVQGVFQNASSRDYKEGITDLSGEDAQAIVDGLNPVTYTLRADGTRRPQAGFISEEVPELVASEDRRAIAPVNIVAALTRVVQSQQRAIRDLEVRLAAMAEGTHR